GLIVVIDDGVVGGLEPVVFLGFTADRERGEQNFGLFGDGRAFVFAGIEHVEGVAGLHLALEVDVVGIDPDHILDDACRHLVAQRGLVNALVEPDAASVIIIVVVFVGRYLGHGIHALHVDGDIFADVGQCGNGFDRGVVGDDHAIGLQPDAGTGGCRR